MLIIQLNKMKKDELTYSPADAICLVCGTAKEDKKSGLCINGHDDWLENQDDMYRFNIAINRFHISFDEIIDAINNNTDIIINDKNEK